MVGITNTLSYSPSDRNLDGRLRHIKVSLKHDHNDQLAYRRAYYATATDSNTPAGDAIAASMEHGAPQSHRLIFGAHVAASAHVPGKDRLYILDYTVMKQQLWAAHETAPHFEIAVAAYDADGRLLNSIVNQAVEDSSSPDKRLGTQNAYRMEQQLSAPLSARFLRFAVRDLQTGSTGAMEIPLPLSPAGRK